MKKLFHFALLFAILFSCPFVSPAVAQKEPKEILSIEAYDMLNTVPNTYLIDVRTRAEYQFIGHAPMAYLFPYIFMTNKLTKENEEWVYGFGDKNKDFIQEIKKKFLKTNNLLMISRDGTRSSLAAQELIKNGFENVYNVKDGFEGKPFPYFEDKNRHKFYRQLAKRNKIPGYGHRRFYGWQHWGLPWTYNIEVKYIYPPDSIPKEG